MSTMNENEHNLLDETITALTQFDNNLARLLQALDSLSAESSAFQHLDEEIGRLETTSSALCSSLEKALLQAPKIISELNVKDQDLERLQLSKRNSERLLKAQEEKIARLESELATVKDQALGQFESVSWIGSIMGAMLWKSCKQHESVKALVGTDSLKDFLGMANCVLSSFVTRQRTGAKLSPDTEDFKFLASICGALTNLAAFPEGRAHLATETDGLLFANNLLNALQLFRMPAGRLLKRMSLTFVYNVCLEENGARFVVGDETRLQSIISCLDLVNSEDVLTLAVSLLIRLMKAAPEYEYKAAIALQIPKGIVRQMVITNNQQLKETATHLVELAEFDWLKASIRST